MTRHIVNIALHPVDERLIDVAAYLAEYGAAGRRATVPHARCPLCLAELVPGPDRSDAPRRFRHRSLEDEARCPLGTASYQPAGLAVRQRRDPDIERLHRQEFVAHWPWHFDLMRQAVPLLTMERFIRLVEYADVLNLWSYRALDQRDVPYVLLALADFMVQRVSHGMLTWLRFCFDASAQDVGDLWRSDGRRPQIFKIRYREPHATPFPTAAQIIDWEPVVRNPTFLDGPMPRLRRTDMAAFQRFLNPVVRLDMEQSAIYPGGL